jgi:DNA-binding response OmpR family regulator
MKKILIIEDDQVVGNIYRNKLVLEGFRVEIALDGEAGLALLESFQPDLLLLDLMLPKISGIELMKTVRATEAFQQLPIIVFSSTYLTNVIQEAWKAGATKCLSKASCTPKQVIEVVRSVLGATAPGAPGPATRTGSSSAALAAAADGVKTGADRDSEFQTELKKAFIDNWPATLTSIRGSLQNLTKSEGDANRLNHLGELYRRIHSLTGNAGLTGMSQIAQLSDALEVLLKELYEHPKNINASTTRTVASAIDLLGILFDTHQRTPGLRDLTPARVLVVDDEAISCRAITYSLEKARLKSICVENPNRAFEMLLESRYDLIILDIGMPEMNGFELCSRLRALPAYQKTPVVFVTSLNDFESRTNSMMSGGNDFIAKPFLFMELAVKALGYVLRGKLQAAKN